MSTTRLKTNESLIGILMISLLKMALAESARSQIEHQPASPRSASLALPTGADKYYYWEHVQSGLSIIIFIMIVVGNLSILHRLKSCRRRRSNVNYFIVQLAIADLFVGFFSVTLDALLRLQKAFKYGSLACKSTKYISVLFIYSSTYLLVALSIDRWEAVVKPLAFTKNRSRGYYLVAGAWLLAFISALPVTMFTGIKLIGGLPQCWIDLRPLGWKLYMVYLTCSLLIIPAIIIAICYIHIVYTIWSKGQLVSSQQSKRRLQDKADLQLQLERQEDENQKQLNCIQNSLSLNQNEIRNKCNQKHYHMHPDSTSQETENTESTFTDEEDDDDEDDEEDDEGGDEDEGDEEGKDEDEEAQQAIQVHEHHHERSLSMNHDNRLEMSNIGHNNNNEIIQLRFEESVGRRQQKQRQGRKGARRAAAANQLGRQRQPSFAKGVGCNSLSAQQHGSGVIPKARIKTIKMTLVIVAAFILCWAPFYIINLCSVFGLMRNDTNFTIALKTLTQSLAHLNSAANPIIFWLFSSGRNRATSASSSNGRINCANDSSKQTTNK